MELSTLTPPSSTLAALAATQAQTPAPPRLEELVRLGPLEVSRTTLEIVTRIGGLAVTIVTALVLLRLVPLLERLIIRWASRSSGKSTDRAATESSIDLRQRVETLTRVTGSVARAMVWTTTIIVVLGNLGIAIAPLLAGAGIAGVAVGFGAQSIVKDFFSGFFILLENQYDVGDTVTIGAVTGTVERMTMRITVVRDTTGAVHFLPNSAVTNVANKTYGWARAAVDAVLSPTISEATARALLEAAAARATAMPDMDMLVLEPVAIEGPTEFAPTGVTWRLSAKTVTTRTNEVKRALISALSAELHARGVYVDTGAFALKG